MPVDRPRLAHPILMVALAALLAVSVCGTLPAADSLVKETPAERDARMKWWRDARFGMFIHWGVYSVPAGEYGGKKPSGAGEWIKAWDNIPNSDYDQYLKQFNPSKYDTAQWVRLAKAAGVKYIVITSKHHDGFCLWDSKVTDYDVAATPYQKSLLKPLSDECKRQGITFCLYYSIMDWHHPSQFIAAKGKHPDSGDGQTQMRRGMKKDYVDYMKAQLKELVDEVDPAVFWFDGEWVNWWTHEDGVDLYNYCRSLKPTIIVNNRVDKGRKGMGGLNQGDKIYAGDFGTPEQQIPPSGLGPGIDWESCMTMNNTWGFKKSDTTWKSAPTLITNLVDIASKGGNYLLNVGPTAEGFIPPASVERLTQMGAWLDKNGESIYGTTATPLGKLDFGRSTQKPGRLYLHVFNWPDEGRLEVPPIANKITGAYLLADASRKPLQVTQSERSLFVLVPKEAPDPVDTVIVLEIDGGVKLVAGKDAPKSK